MNSSRTEGTKPTRSIDIFERLMELLQSVERLTDDRFQELITCANEDLRRKRWMRLLRKDSELLDSVFFGMFTAHWYPPSSPRHQAIADLFDAYIASGAMDPNGISGSTGWRKLELAIFNGALSGVRALLDKGAETNFALHAAQSRGASNLIEFAELVTDPEQTAAMVAILRAHRMRLAIDTRQDGLPDSDQPVKPPRSRDL